MDLLLLSSKKIVLLKQNIVNDCLKISNFSHDYCTKLLLGVIQHVQFYFFKNIKKLLLIMIKNNSKNNINGNLLL